MRLDDEFDFHEIPARLSQTGLPAAPGCTALWRQKQGSIVRPFCRSTCPTPSQPDVSDTRPDGRWPVDGHVGGWSRGMTVVVSWGGPGFHEILSGRPHR